MANIKPYTFTLLIILILVHYKSMSCEGRHLIAKDNTMYKRCLGEGDVQTNKSGEMVEGSVEVEAVENNADAVVTDDTRPSILGHSPGVRRSFHANDPKTNL